MQKGIIGGRMDEPVFFGKRNINPQDDSYITKPKKVSVPWNMQLFSPMLRG